MFFPLALFFFSSNLSFQTFQGEHDQEICGLKWSPDGTQLASGGTKRQKQLLIPILNFVLKEMTISCAFGSLAMTLLDCVVLSTLLPSRPSLGALGRATSLHLEEEPGEALFFLFFTANINLIIFSDRKIRFWNTSTGACLNVVDTHSQVCSILWSKHSKELVSSHGFSQNQVGTKKKRKINHLIFLTRKQSFVFGSIPQ